MKRAFTLIEVLIAVGIIAFIGAVLLKIVSNNTFFISRFLQQNNFATFVSFFSQLDDKSHKKEFFIKDTISSNYNIKDDDLNRYLKPYKIIYQDQLIATKSLFEEHKKKRQADKEEVWTTDEEVDLDKDKGLDLKIEIRKQIITTISADMSDHNVSDYSDYIYYIREEPAEKSSLLIDESS